MYGDMRRLFDAVRNPMYNWNESYSMASIPEEGTRVRIAKVVEDEYEVVYVRDESGKVVEWKHVKVDPEKPLSYGGTD